MSRKLGRNDLTGGMPMTQDQVANKNDKEFVYAFATLRSMDGVELL